MKIWTWIAHHIPLMYEIDKWIKSITLKRMKKKLGKVKRPNL
jgi:hypothetical protein